MQKDAEQRTDPGAQYGQHSNSGRGRNGKFRKVRKKELLRCNLEVTGNALSHQRRNHTGNQGSIMHNAHADHLHGKNGGSHGSAEKHGKCGTHTAHNHNVLIFFIKSEQSSQGIADAASKLQSGSLPPGGTAEQVCHNSGNKDQRSHFQRNMFAGINGRKHQIGAGIFFIVHNMVSAHNQKSRRRQKENQPGIRSPC